ncbi:hypothetical protein JG687_00005586 [Phytophthora cactorum]|uniref:Uncharacterized protein n=1 Tax=Phytophthora cactorum TaxID=29920 RepID=A0A8T1ULU1_9STRA|nr:hypothetical protein JG687_00005586 [Phytophthora cactorum]
MPRLLHVGIPLLQKLYMSKTNPKTNQERQNSIERIMHSYFERPPSSRIFDVEEASSPKASSFRSFGRTFGASGVIDYIGEYKHRYIQQH